MIQLTHLIVHIFLYSTVHSGKETIFVFVCFCVYLPMTGPFLQLRKESTWMLHPSFPSTAGQCLSFAIGL